MGEEQLLLSYLHISNQTSSTKMFSQKCDAGTQELC